MAFLRRTDLISIEDVLPFFPDFAVIDDCKDDICEALEGYASHIESLKDEMDEASRSAAAIQQDIAKLSERFVTIDPDQSAITACRCWCRGNFTSSLPTWLPCGLLDWGSDKDHVDKEFAEAVGIATADFGFDEWVGTCIAELSVGEHGILEGWFEGGCQCSTGS